MMHGLTVRQPWGSAIALADPNLLGPLRGKTLENRTWPPPRQLIGKHFAVHAGVHSFDQADAVDVGRLLYGSDATRDQWQRWIAELTAGCGRILGVAKLAGFTTGKLPPHQARWRVPKHIAWQLEDVRALGRPILFRGKQGLWHVPSETEAEIRAQVAL